MQTVSEFLEGEGHFWHSDSPERLKEICIAMHHVHLLILIICFPGGVHCSPVEGLPQIASWMKALPEEVQDAEKFPKGNLWWSLMEMLKKKKSGLDLKET